jgi:hypothetical protein
VHEGQPHLRIENRILPSGPSPVDEMANAAFWFGLVSGMARQEEDVRDALDFDDARTNFIAAARLGLASQFTWLHGRRVPAQQLILDELLPIARDGLISLGYPRLTSTATWALSTPAYDRSRPGRSGCSTPTTDAPKEAGPSAWRRW